MARQKTGKAALATEERRRKAFDLRLAGCTYEQIGEALGISKQAAYKLVDTTLVASREETAETAEKVREMEIQRCDALLVALWPNRRDPGTTGSILKVMERRSKLLGLDALQRSEVKVEGMTEAQLDSAILAIVEAARAREAGGTGEGQGEGD